MKVGDKVYVELEVKQVDESDFMFKGCSNDNRSHWIYINQAITQLPIQEGRWIMVSDDKKDWKKRFVIGKVDSFFVTYDLNSGFTRWNFAKEIPTKRKLTMQEIAEKFNEDVENIEICTE